MKNNKITWVVIGILLMTTIAVSIGSLTGYSQKDNSKKQDDGYEDFSKYAVADYDATLSGDATEREERILKSKRYDGQSFVLKNPHPDDGGVDSSIETPPPPIIPVVESDLIVIGEVVNASAYLSNDKQGIYTEFTTQIDEVLKNDAYNKVVPGNSVFADRTGGFVKYPSSQKVLYTISGRDLPYVGGKYVLFLTSSKGNPNYEILTGYELKGDNIIRLDMGRRFDEFEGTTKLNFIKAIQNKISETLKNNQGEKNER